MRSAAMTFGAVGWAIGTLAFALAAAGEAGRPLEPAPWHSRSLTDETVTGPNGAITTRTALDADGRWGIPPEKTVEAVTEGVYALRGWGIASSFAIDAPKGWIVVDTGDSTRAASEMRALLEEKIGRKVKVAAIVLTHWHYADGTAAWMDEGTELWGHELLDANRSASTGVSVLSGVYQARAAAQFGVFHPRRGPDAFPNHLGFTPEKLLAVSSYRPPAHLFANGRILSQTIAGEPLEVAPNRSDTTDSVGFYFPRRRLLVTNFMAPGGIFNIYTLRGGSYRNPAVFIADARWLEAKKAEILLDIHAATVRGEPAVREAIEHATDRVQLIHDQTLRMIALGRDAREAAEGVYMPARLRDGWENYGQVESHVRQVYNGTIGWFGGDVYEINPLSLREEAERTIGMMGGADAVRKVAADAANAGGLANWRWTLKLTSMLLQLDPQDAAARESRAAAARALGQRTTTANARGFYLNEALELEGRLLVNDHPMTMDALRASLGTPAIDQLVEESPEANLQFARYLVDPRKAEGKRFSFTLAVDGAGAAQRVELRNGVLVISGADPGATPQIKTTRRKLAEFVLGQGALATGGGPLAELDAVLDRSHLAPAVAATAAGAKEGKASHVSDAEQ